MDALRADCGEAIVLVTPAFPETGRTVYQGNLFVGAVPLNESPLKDHPLNPMRDSNLVRVLARQSKTQIGLVDLATVTRGADAVAGAAGRALGQGHRRRHHRRRVRPRPRNHRPRRRRASAVGRRLRHRSRAGAGAGVDGHGQGGRGEQRDRRARSADRRPASPEAARRRRFSRSPVPSRSCRCCTSIPTISSRALAKRSARWPGPGRGWPMVRS